MPASCSEGDRRIRAATGPLVPGIRDRPFQYVTTGLHPGHERIAQQFFVAFDRSAGPHQRLQLQAHSNDPANVWPPEPVADRSTLPPVEVKETGMPGTPATLVAADPVGVIDAVTIAEYEPAPVYALIRTCRLTVSPPIAVGATTARYCRPVVQVTVSLT